MTTVDTHDDSGPGTPQVALLQSPGFWIIVGYAVLFGVVLAFASLVFLALVKALTNLWFTLPADLGWFSGEPWWVVVTAGVGLLVGVLRRAFRLPGRLPGTVVELRDERVEPSTVLGSVVVSVVSLGGGASLGPEDALGKMGGGLGTWISERRKLGDDIRATNTLSGMSAAYGGMLSSPTFGTERHPGARASDAGTVCRCPRGRPAGRLGLVRGVFPDRRVDFRRPVRPAALPVRGLAAHCGHSPGPRRRCSCVGHHRRRSGS